jgi:hypothetical protein
LSWSEEIGIATVFISGERMRSADFELQEMTKNKRMEDFKRIFNVAGL